MFEVSQLMSLVRVVDVPEVNVSTWSMFEVPCQSGCFREVKALRVFWWFLGKVYGFWPSFSDSLSTYKYLL